MGKLFFLHKKSRNCLIQFRLFLIYHKFYEFFKTTWIPVYVP